MHTNLHPTVVQACLGLLEFVEKQLGAHHILAFMPQQQALRHAF